MTDEEFESKLLEIRSRVLSKAITQEEENNYTEALFKSIRHINEHKEDRIQGIRILITDNIEEKVPKEKTTAKLQKHYNLTESQAQKNYTEFIKNNSPKI